MYTNLAIHYNTILHTIYYVFTVLYMLFAYIHYVIHVMYTPIGILLDEPGGQREVVWDTDGT